MQPPPRQEYQKKLPDSVAKELDKYQHEFGKVMLKVTKNRISIERLEREVQILSDKQNRRYPPGCKAFKSSDTQAELDVVIRSFAAADSSLTIPMPQGEGCGADRPP